MGQEILNPKRKTSRVLIVDDHPIVREGYVQLISGQQDLEVCGTAGDAAQALRQLETLQADLAVIDITLKGSDGIDLVKQIKSRYASLKMLVASAHDETLYAERALQAGAAGYINKQEATELLIEAIRVVLDGRVYLSPQMTDRILKRATGSPCVADLSPINALSNRELEVFRLIGQGLSTRQIASQLHLSAKTIETYRENVKRKLNYQNGAEMTRHAVQWVLENQ